MSRRSAHELRKETGFSGRRADTAVGVRRAPSETVNGSDSKAAITACDVLSPLTCRVIACSRTSVAWAEAPRSSTSVNKPSRRLLQDFKSVSR
eukprot:2259249-Rhodomonas_salina.2